MTIVNFNDPGVVQRKLSKETLDRLNSYIKNKKQNWNKELVGQINSSFFLEDKNNWFFEKEVLPTIEEYMDQWKVFG